MREAAINLRAPAGATKLDRPSGKFVGQDQSVLAILVHAIHDRARQFYEHYGFKVSPAHPMTLMLRLNDLQSPHHNI